MNRPDDSPGPTIWAAREVRREVPTEGEVVRAVLLILLAVVILIGALVAWVTA